MKIHRKSVFYRTFYLCISSVFLQLAGFVYRIMLIRLAGSEAVGIHHLLMQVYGVVMALSVSGISLAVSKLSAERVALSQSSNVPLIIRDAFYIYIAVFSCVSLIIFLNAELICENILGNIKALPGLMLLIPCMLLTGFENIYKSCFIGAAVIKPPIISETSEQLTRIIAVALIFGFVIKASPEINAAFIVFCTIISEIVSFLILNRLSRRNFHKRKTKKQCYAFKILGIAIPISFSGVFNNLLSAANNIIIPKRLVASGTGAQLALKQVGDFFGISMPLVMLPMAFIAPMVQILVPKISESLILKNYSDVKRKTGKAIQATSIISMGILSLVVALSEEISIIFYKNIKAAGLIGLLSVAGVFLFYAFVTTSVLNTVKMEKQVGTASVIISILQIIITWEAVYYLGMSGYAAGFLLSEALSAFVNFIMIWRKLKLKFMVKNWFLIPLGAALITFGLSYMIKCLLFSFAFNNIAVLVISALCGAIVYVFALLILGINLIRYFKTISD